MPLSSAQIDAILGAGKSTALQEGASNPMFKALELLSRPGEMAMAGISGVLPGGLPIEDTLDTMGNVATGQQNYTGRNFLESYGAPDSAWTTAGGIALDFLNPADPLNYIGVGGLTKIGKAAKLAGPIDSAAGLAAKWSGQAAAGQRGLLNFAGHQVPLPGQGMALDALQGLGNRFADSGTGKALSSLFGGRTGAYASAMRDDPDAALIQMRAQDRIDFKLNKATAEWDAVADPIFEKLSFEERVLAGDLMQDAARNGQTWADKIDEFVKPGTRGAATRLEQAKNIDTLYQTRARLAAENLGETGIGMYSEATARYLPRMFKRNPLVSNERVDEVLGGPVGRQIIHTEPFADNAFNQGLVQSSLQSPQVKTLDIAGKAAWLAGGEVKVGDEVKHLVGQDWFDAHDAVFKREFLLKHRKTTKELNLDLAATGAGEYERDISAMFAGMKGELLQNIKYDGLVKDFQEAGIAVDWNDILHGGGEFVKVNQGRWANAPLAIPKNLNTALARYESIAHPSAEAGRLGEQLLQLVPKALRDATQDSQRWMKDLLIWGGGPFSYMTRNVASAVHKNRLEGINSLNGPRYYGEAIHLMGKFFGDKGKMLNPLSNLDETAKGITNEYWTSKNGVKYSIRRLAEEYLHGNMHGGGSPDPELVSKSLSGSAKLRNKLFGTFHKGNMRAEMFVRLPLMLKTLEDTEDVVLAMKRALPKTVEEMAAEPKVAGTFFDVAMTNAREAVIRAHFDYNDLTETERKIRGTVMPFYSWWRKNIAHETVNLIQKPGKYMPYIRAYQSSFDNEDMTQADLPEWAQRAFAMPIDESVEGKIQWMDFTGFLPFMDTLEAGVTAATLTGMIDAQPGKTPISEFIRYMAIRGNPMLVMPVEQGLNKSFFTGRDMREDQPEKFGAATVSPQVRHALQPFRPLSELDRLNPTIPFLTGGKPIFGENRKNRNEPNEAKRWARHLTGVRMYEAEDNIASMSEKTRKKTIRAYTRAMNEAIAEGDNQRADYFKGMIEKIGGTVK